MFFTRAWRGNPARSFYLWFMRLILTSLLLWIALAFTPANSLRNPYPQGYFRWPVDHPVRLSGTFGELRPNHFHAGLDIRSKAQRIGDPLYAAAEGYVARIKVEESGYGRGLYIAHPNGYTTVYAHMERFTEELDGYVKHQQYQQQCFDVDIYPPPHLFRLAKGQYIGDMGNTGASAGPHLHFEIRETRTDKALNPLLFGLPITDKMAPRPYTLKLYHMDGIGVHGAKTQNFTLYSRSGKYTTQPETLAVNTPFAAFAVKAFDMHDSPSNKNGIYAMEMTVDGQLALQFALDEVPFEDTRFINAHMDYEEFASRRNYLHRCFQLPGNNLNVYPLAMNHGLVSLQNDEVKQIEIKVWDALENENSIRFWVKRDGEKAPPMPGPYQYFIYTDADNLVQTEQCTAFIPRGTVYEDLPMNFRTAPGLNGKYLSDIFHIHDYLTPAHQFFVVSLKPGRELTEAEKVKAFVGYINPRGSVVNCGGVWKEGRLTAPVRDFGPYAILVDNSPPSVKPSRFQYDMRGKASMSFRISDNYTTARNIDRMSYSATVDGKWILMEFDRKSSMLVHRFDKRIAPGKHLFRLEVTDVMGNTTVFEKHFLR